ncbi:arginine N-succinyltransferase [Larsenimonas suaedae]|uniref:Arginine N-succinyltransferase n=1 Tax=Larsenimonas suaedae TaxID=1851019 RepID=A0ABU1GV33_9GAMM|nr:arginine N-succinyltransferase [Larsenimonas suaedae]MCM2971200.1 arginine N-succinyltransferase [Larsenimonas suaedae]MDR5895909.1 arginine N-succinyltransferase [Larsenimonas suaedae]
MRVRPVRATDLDDLIRLSAKAGKGLTSLPSDRTRLAARIDHAERTFKGHNVYGEGDFLFVLETDDSQVIGMCGLMDAVGIQAPWYNYRVSLSVASSDTLGVIKHQDILMRSNDLTGKSELCSLFLDPGFRGGQAGRLLSKSRLLFVAHHPERFGDSLVAELRGVSDDSGRSPFWESLGRHFFDMTFSDADWLTGIGNKRFIAELMPRYPIYTTYLSDEARAAIAQVHPDTQGARRLLEQEGFHYNHHIDIFDAGPALECPLDRLRLVNDRVSVTLATLEGSVKSTLAEPFLVLAGELDHCRMTTALAYMKDEILFVDDDTLRRLECLTGTTVSAAPLAATRQHRSVS